MATTRIAAEIDNVGPNIFIDVVPASQRYGPRNYIRPSHKQCIPSRLYQFKKSNGVPPPDQNPPLKRGDTKPDYKQSTFYKTIKHQRYAQLEARKFRHDLSDEVRQTFGDIVNDDGTQYGWLDRARANISLVEVRDTLVREQRQNDAEGGTQQSSQQEIGGQTGREGTTQRQQAMRRGIAINGQRRRQGLRNSRNVRLSLNSVSQRRAQTQRARQVQSTPEQITREARPAQLATQTPSTPIDAQIIGVLQEQMQTHVDALINARNNADADGLQGGMTGYENAFAAYDALNNPNSGPPDSTNPPAFPNGVDAPPVLPGSPIDLEAMRARLNELKSDGPSTQQLSSQALSPIQEEAEEQEEGAAGGQAKTQATGSAGPEAADSAGGDEQIESETILLATSPPPAARHREAYEYLGADDQIRHGEYEAAYQNPLEHRWHNLERYEARDSGVLTGEETRTSWRTKDLDDLTSPELRLRSNLDMERSWRELQQGRCRFQVEHERNMREHEARLAEIRAGRPMTPVGHAASAVTSAPVTPSRADRPVGTPNAPARSTYAAPSVEVDSDEDL
ncbi:hypothetical protein Slin15195_G070400 [Septoria linicola]|uniref:Uncharacterized protein n=1 Tax=Septoria linicola TaxID=215465 RepID=A0A9Q9AXQ2_9PEZI|nr:hypothetical protein Slin15195_G070400 [Septoria linicola]